MEFTIAFAAGVLPCPRTSRPLLRILYRDHASHLSEYQLSGSIYIDAIVHGLQLLIIHVTRFAIQTT